MNLNKVIIIGRLTQDPQLRTTPTGQSVATISVATGRVWTDKSGSKQEETEYHSVVVWGRQAEIASQFLNKGSLVCIEGRLRTRTWQDKTGGNRKTTEIISECLQLGPKPSGTGGGERKFSSRGGSASGGDFTPKHQVESSAVEEIPTINFEEEGDIKAEDLPF